MPRKSSWIVFVLMALAPGALHAHPGRLDESGCHQVRERYEYNSGKVLEPGTHHCHRPLGKMRLDGKEMLHDPSDQGIPTKDKRRIERRGYE